jgi:hypothetical protein
MAVAAVKKIFSLTILSHIVLAKFANVWHKLANFAQNSSRICRVRIDCRPKKLAPSCRDLGCVGPGWLLALVFFYQYVFRASKVCSTKHEFRYQSTHLYLLGFKFDHQNVHNVHVFLDHKAKSRT